MQKGGSVIQATWMPEPLKRGNQSEAGKSPHRVRILLKLNAFSDTGGGMDKVLPWANAKSHAILAIKVQLLYWCKHLIRSKRWQYLFYFQVDCLEERVTINMK